MPEDQAAYVAGWRKLLPEYEIRLWNETNFDVNAVPFTLQVAKAKKWGFIVDYIRAYVVYHYGGVYLDTDVELLKPFDEAMLQNKCFSGFEDDKFIAPGLIFAGEKGSVIAKDLMDFYSSYNFIQGSGELNLTPSPQIFTGILLKYGLKQNNTYQELGLFTAYPREYFCPMSFKTGEINISGNTYSVHHYAMSWYSDLSQYFVKKSRAIYKILGDNMLSKMITLFLRMITSFLSFCTRIKKTGLKNGFSYYINRYIKKKQ